MRPVTLFRGWSLAGCYAAMLVIGLLLSIYGPIVAVLQDRFDLSGAAAGAALGTQSFGAVIGVLLAQSALRAKGNRTTTTTALLCITLGVTMIACAPTWPLVIIGTGIAGLGFGGVDSIVTQLILVGSGSKGPSRANIAHAWFGIGTVAGPILIYLVGPANYPWVFGGCAVVTLLALVSATGLAARPTPAEVTAAAPTSEKSTPARGSALGGAVIAGFVTLYLTHFAVQGGIGNWAPTVLEQQSGLAPQIATLFLSGFWLAMVLGRFAAAALTRHLSPGALVTISSIALTIAVATTVLPAAAPWAYLIAGLFLGPIFPTGMAWLSTTGYGRGNTFAYVIAGAMLGMAITPSFVGGIIEQHGTKTAPIVLLTITAFVLLSSLTVHALISRARTKPLQDTVLDSNAA